MPQSGVNIMEMDKLFFIIPTLLNYTISHFLKLPLPNK